MVVWLAAGSGRFWRGADAAAAKPTIAAGAGCLGRARCPHPAPGRSCGGPASAWSRTPSRPGCLPRRTGPHRRSTTWAGTLPGRSVAVPFFRSPVSSTTSTASGLPRCSTTYSRTSSRTAPASHRAAANRCCIPSGVASPACSAIVQQFLRRSPTATPARTPAPAAAAPPAQTGPRSAPSAHQTVPATGLDLR
jgi:hypothetical protein